MSVVKRFLSDTFIYGLSTIVARLLNFIQTPLFIKKFDTAVYGIFTNMYAWAAFINTFLAFGMETTYFRYLNKVEETERPKVFNTTFIVAILTTIVFVFSLLTFLQPISIWFAKNGLQQVSDYRSYIYCMGFTLAADALAVVPFAKLRAQNRPIRYGLLKLINILVFMGLNVFFLAGVPWLLSRYPEFQNHFSWFKEGWVGYVFVSNLVASVITLILLLPQIKGFSFVLERQLLRSMLSYSFPIFVANVSYIVNENLDKILLPHLIPGEHGESDLGIYGAIAKIAVFLSIFVQAFRLGAEPFFFSFAKNENAKKVYALIMEYFVVAMMLVMVGLSMNIEWLKYFIEGGDAEQSAKYWSGLNFIPVILFNYVLLGIYMNLSVWYKLSDQTRYGLYISGVGAVITSVLCYILIPHFSYVGAILVTSIAYSVMVSLSYIWGQRNYAIPYDLKKMGMYMFIGTAAVAVNYLFLERSFWSGNAMLMGYILFIVWQEKVFIRRVLKSLGN
ncbi:lipopolysaccharide biosynthesis protein [Sphingobacterium pedocola]|uniref:Polysaccharide biosynthesis protein n=1 Tax=Sphingobacterium pedocola TaxID=2082722 RepID=A0ABR9TA39_9SPHI|nr:oligosaccharide flippase family protein [Sphingobacterium pedocola]MBE8722210.1 polysaccharide biosynthesis protein [Sphingobacterium pedocola]